MLILDLFISVILPIFILLGVGVIAGKLLAVEITTLTQVAFNIYTPAIVFVIIVDTTLQAGSLVRVAGFSFLQWGLTFALGYGLYTLPRLTPDRVSMAFGAAFINGGNYGLPLMLLTFGQEALAVHAVPFVLQAILMFTVGVVLIDPASNSVFNGVKQLLRLPVIWGIILGFGVRLLGIPLPDPLRVPLDQLEAGYISLALLTLGAQLAAVKVRSGFWAISPTLAIRLVISPAVAVGLVAVLGLEGLAAQTLVLGAGLPTAVNTYIIATEYDRDPDLASLVVFWSTVFSALTLPPLALLVQTIY